MMPEFVLGTLRTMLERALFEANKLGFAPSVCIVDAGGHILLAQRDPGTGWASMEIALAKTRAALAFGTSPGSMAEVAEITLLKLTQPAGEGLLFLGGADVIRLNGNIVGAMAVSGASEEQDQICVEKAMVEWR